MVARRPHDKLAAYACCRQMLLEHVYSHFQPWFEDAVSAILDESAIAALRRGKYVGVHIRRTDKLVSEAEETETEVRVAVHAQAMYERPQFFPPEKRLVGLPMRRQVASFDFSLMPCHPSDASIDQGAKLCWHLFP